MTAPFGEECRVGWTCPQCQSPHPPRETPAGTFCVTCRLKLISCCEGAPLPPRDVRQSDHDDR